MDRAFDGTDNARTFGHSCNFRQCHFEGGGRGVGSLCKLDEHDSGLVPLTEMGARVYNSATGRFLQTGPIEGGTLNDYVYVSDPINQFDLTGQCWFCVPKFMKKAVKIVGNAVKTGVRKTYQAARFVRNAPTALASYVGVKLTAKHSDCGMNWQEIMIVCKGTTHGGLNRHGGTTYGSLFVTSNPDPGADSRLMAHEAKHADRVCPGFG